ncbi:hypothetical protein A3A84_00295 [Candidatus Collierbacteria bacterium RIFCSPLOWO2_01_FULL_50_23]|nr:MAG: hypothetical protein A3A84_00295 [Candidatus Collierbacteria bacterium RIFCSPLOWO2_01_FULL_50_23]
MKTKKLIFLVLGVLAALTLTACMDEGVAQNERATDWQLQQYNKAQKVHAYTYSWERWVVQTLYDFRITKLTSTWSVWVGDGTGEPIDYCASKGFGVPYNTSLTNPDQIASGGYVIGMMEPNGLYPGGSTSATWILCVEDDGSLHPRYVEPQVIVYDYPIVVAFDAQRGMYRIVRAGAASTDTMIVPPTNINPEILNTAPGQ